MLLTLNEVRTTQSNRNATKEGYDKLKRKWTVLGLQLGSLRRQLQRKRHFKLKKNFASGQVCCDFHMLVALDKIGGVCLRLPCTKTIRVEAKNERFIAACWRCRENFKDENFSSSLGRLRQKKVHQKACRTCSTNIFVKAKKLK